MVQSEGVVNVDGMAGRMSFVDGNTVYSSSWASDEAADFAAPPTGVAVMSESMFPNWAPNSHATPIMMAVMKTKQAIATRKITAASPGSVVGSLFFLSLFSAASFSAFCLGYKVSMNCSICDSSAFVQIKRRVDVNHTLAHWTEMFKKLGSRGSFFS